MKAGGEGKAAASGWDEEVAHRGEDRDEARQASRRAQALHLALASPEGGVAVLGSVVEALVGAVLERGRDLAPRRAVGGQPVGHDAAWAPALPLRQPGEQAARRALVAPAPRGLARHGAVPVHGPPQPAHPAADHDAHLARVPNVARTRRPAAQLAGEDGPELHAPAAPGLVRDVDPALEQQLLEHAQAEGQAGVQPHGVGDDLTRKAMPAVEGADRPGNRGLRTMTDGANRWTLSVTSPVRVLLRGLGRHYRGTRPWGAGQTRLMRRPWDAAAVFRAMGARALSCPSGPVLAV